MLVYIGTYHVVIRAIVVTVGLFIIHLSIICLPSITVFIHHIYLFCHYGFTLFIIHLSIKFCDPLWFYFVYTFDLRFYAQMNLVLLKYCLTIVFKKKREMKRWHAKEA